MLLRKVFYFLVNVAINGLLAIFIAPISQVILLLIFVCTMIPISIIAGDDVAQRIRDFVDHVLLYKVSYTISFILMMMDDLGAPNFKTVLKRWL